MEKDSLGIFIYANREQSLASAKRMLAVDLEDLEATVEVNVASNGWLEVILEGDDAEFGLNFLKSKYGSPSRRAKPDTIYGGYFKSAEEEYIVVDIGRNMKIPVANLKNLGAGNAKQIATRFGLIPYFPVKVQISKDEQTLEFASETVELLWKWKKSPIDRVIVNSSTRSKIKAAIKKTGHGKDILGVEKLGLLENVIVCKEGTDGPGIVAAIGPLLKSDMGVVKGNR